MMSKFTFTAANRKTIKKNLRFGFLIYLFVMGWFLFISVDSIKRSNYFTEREIHLIPFKATYIAFEKLNNNVYHISAAQIPYYRFLLVRNIIGNIILFIPWGLTIPILFKNFYDIRNLLLITCVVCFFIEVVQYIFVLGVCDIDDIIYNVVGAVVGFYLFKLLRAKLPL
jgi:glycopeptide antibiotics resistance protein